MTDHEMIDLLFKYVLVCAEKENIDPDLAERLLAGTINADIEEWTEVQSCNWIEETQKLFPQYQIFEILRSHSRIICFFNNFLRISESWERN
ncbi:hypothetical protein NIES4101_74090 [Calothrix sp. NIES-4101]|nr:hypothetical protein NIES4101_74090 [Calothrix sp. NIES-4101]